jgi:hypothetical protein
MDPTGALDFDLLAAQRDAAHWAAVSAISSVFGLIVSVLGLATIAFQLRLTRKSVEDAGRSADAAAAAARISQSSVRPWLKIELGSKGDLFEESRRVNIAAKITNVGQTPALDYFAFVVSIPWTVSLDGAVNAKIAEMDDEQKRRRALGVQQGAIFPNDHRSSHFQTEWLPSPDGLQSIAIMFAYYYSSDGEQFHRTVLPLVCMKWDADVPGKSFVSYSEMLSFGIHRVVT